MKLEEEWGVGAVQWSVNLKKDRKAFGGNQKKKKRGPTGKIFPTEETELLSGGNTGTGLKMVLHHINFRGKSRGQG